MPKDAAANRFAIEIAPEDKGAAALAGIALLAQASPGCARTNGQLLFPQLKSDDQQARAHAELEPSNGQTACEVGRGHVEREPRGFAETCASAHGNGTHAN